MLASKLSCPSTAAVLIRTESNRRREHQWEVELTCIRRVNGKVAALLSAFTISNGTIICENRKAVESCGIFLSQLSTIAIHFQITATVPERIPSPNTGGGFCSLMKPAFLSFVFFFFFYTHSAQEVKHRHQAPLHLLAIAQC